MKFPDEKYAQGSHVCAEFVHTHPHSFTLKHTGPGILRYDE